jgi:eukaryotic-like serine/threonine-protein kinase
VLPRIDRYEITNEIGHGGMATVYRARDTRLDRWVAVKVMHPHLRGTEQARARFAREARAVARLRHPAILEIYDYSGHDSENAYIATELLSGPTLRGFLDQVGEIPPEMAACIGAELAAALAAAHAHGIVHRDVKPENVLLHEHRVKLTDFGIADMLDPSMSAMTATGQLLGSPAHMAPEQVEAGDSDARSDVFALGTIMYLLATGTLPFSGKNPHQVLKRVVDCAPLDPATLRPALGKPLRDIIMRCLSKSPDDRYQTAHDLEEALRKALSAVGIDDPPGALEAYLSDPTGERPRVEARVHAALLASAREAVAARDRPRAIELLDRVLTLRDGDADALRLLAQLDRAARARVAARGALMVAALLGVGALWYASAPKIGAVWSTVADKPRAQLHESERAPGREERANVAVTPIVPDVDASLMASSVPAQRPEEARPQRPRDTKPRTVSFDPQPANVTIAIDGGEPKPFGPSFRMIELPPGHHRFHFVGAHGCCKERTVDMEIPPGPGESVVSVRLDFRDARLYVVSNVHADVVLDDGALSGRTRSLLSVPMKRRQDEQHRISVTAPGYKPYTGTVQLRAGDVTQLDISLEPSDPR